MNECEQIHPLLRGYLNESLSARDRRLVARHLNLCASARRELERLRSGPLKAPETPSHSPSEPWDLKILRWLFKTSKPPSRKEEGERKPKPAKPALGSLGKAPQPSSLKPILGVVFFFLALAFLTHFIQNAGENSVVKGTQRWLSSKGFHFFGITPSLELVLDLTNLAHWTGNAAPVALPYHELITDPDRFRVFWALLQPGAELPAVDFTKNDLVAVFLGPKPTAGYAVRFKRMEDYSDKTLFWYDEVAPAGNEAAAGITRPWVLQLVPKPSQAPVLIQKIQ